MRRSTKQTRKLPAFRPSLAELEALAGRLLAKLITTIDAYATIPSADAAVSTLLEESLGLEIDRNKHTALQDGQVRWLIDVVTVACGTGLRSGEVRSMRWSWIYFDEGTITVQETDDFTPKSGDERVIYISGDALEILRRRFEEDSEGLVFEAFQGGKLDIHYLGKRFRYFADLAKLPKGKNFHSTRHTYASWLVQADVDLYRVQKLCGHKSMQTTMRYAHLAPKNLKDAVEQAFGTA